MVKEIHYTMVYYYSKMIENLSKEILLKNLEQMDLNKMSAYLRKHITNEPIYLIGSSFWAKNKRNRTMTLERHVNEWRLVMADSHNVSEYTHCPDYDSSIILLDLVKEIKAFFAN